MACESWQGGRRGNADSQGAKYNSTPSYKNCEHKKDQRRQRLWRKPRRGRRRGRRGASTNSGRVDMSILYRAWPWAWGKGCPSPRQVSTYPEVEGRTAGSTGANRLNCPSTPGGTEPRGHGSGCSLIPGELMLLTDQREWGCPRGLSLPAARPAALGRGEDRLRPFRGQIQGTSTFLQSTKVNQLCPALAFYLSPGP